MVELVMTISLIGAALVIGGEKLVKYIADQAVDYAGRKLGRRFDNR